MEPRPLEKALIALIQASFTNQNTMIPDVEKIMEQYHAFQKYSLKSATR